MRNLEDATVANLIPTTAMTSTTTGTGIDVTDYDGRVKVVLDSTAGGGADHTMDVKLQESDDDSTYTDISGATFTQVTNAAVALEDIHLNIGETKQYVRAVATLAGTSPAFTASVNFIGHKQYR